ncbi:MAG: 16S rRNA (adenine(1518)-N(6)/adenine(1519)-N(6))-dimethyltransferase RsmA [Mycoplasma sp.]
MHKKDVLSYLKINNFVPSKKMGQNFLINDAIKKNIVTVSNVEKDDNVLEIGPGLGAITKYLIEATDNLVVVELDKRLSENLKKLFPLIKLVNDDILSVDIDKLLNEHQYTNVKVVANLPYSISSKIILKLIKVQSIDEINILIQKEMAERLLAKINTKNYNSFTILVSMFADVQVKLKVSKNEFIPIPEVESWFISVKKHNNFNVNFDAIDKLLRVSFSARRKKLTSNLSNVYDKAKVLKIFNDLSWSENLRAENLSKEDYIKLLELLEK